MNPSILKIICGLVIGQSLSSSAYDFEVGGIYYNLDVVDKTVSVTSGKYEGDIVIPSSVTYNNQELPVTSIEDDAKSEVR